MQDWRSRVETFTGWAALVGSAAGSALGFTGVIDQKTAISIVLSLLVAFVAYQMLHNSTVSTSHEPRLASTSGLAAKRTAWEQIQTLSRTTEIIFKWLIAVDDPDKLRWAEDIVQDLAQRDNVSVAVVALDSKRVSPLSVQIVDDRAVFIIDPRKGFHSLSDDDNDLVCRHPEVVKFFREYYEAYWDKAELIKEGRRLHLDRLDQFRRP